MNRLSAVALAMLLVPGSIRGEGSVLRPSAESVLVMRGSSNVTDWRCRGTSLEAEMHVAAPIEKINAVIDRIEDGNIGVWMATPSAGRFPPPTFEMRIPIAALRCGSRGIERDMSRALKSDQYPTIDFRFTELLGYIEHDIDRNVYQTRIRGEISLAGTTRSMEIAVMAQRLDRECFRLQAELPLRMTDFGIVPPTVLLGVVKVRDDLNVRFDLILQVQP